MWLQQALQLTILKFGAAQFVLTTAAASTGVVDHSVKVAVIGSLTIVVTTVLGVVLQRRSVDGQAAASTLAAKIYEDAQRKDERIELLEQLLSVHGIAIPKERHENA